MGKPARKKPRKIKRSSQSNEEDKFYVIPSSKGEWQEGLVKMARQMEKGLATVVEWECKKCKIINYAPVLGRVPSCPKCGKVMKRRDDLSLKELGID
jgi:ssDNA-binding Zn-finger/Zn-ribbon topoisomerase 1